MKTRKLFVIRSLCLLFLASALVGGILQHGAIAKATIERQALLRDSEEVDRLMRENTGIAQLRATNHELEALRPRQRELARLRNEVAQLRAQEAEAAKLRLENVRFASLQNGAPQKETNAMPAGFISRAAMSDAGLSTPEAAVQTYLHAMSEGDVKRVLQCQSIEAQLTPEQEADQSETLRRQFANFPGFIIGETKIISADEEQIGVQASPGGVIFPIHLVRNGNEWNVK
jgi:hypothetical protein